MREMMSRRRRRGSSAGGSSLNTNVKKVIPRFWKVIWVIVGLLSFMAITSITGFYAPDIYMLIIFGIIIIALNIYLVYLLWKDKEIDS